MTEVKVVFVVSRLLKNNIFSLGIDKHHDLLLILVTENLVCDFYFYKSVSTSARSLKTVKAKDPFNHGTHIQACTGMVSQWLTATGLERRLIVFTCEFV